MAIYHELVSCIFERKYNSRPTYFKTPVFDPSGKNHPYELNLWRGLAVEGKPGDWSLMRRHIYEVICRENPMWFAYLMCWIADVFQNPAVKPGVAFNLSGRKGTGKSKVAEWLRKIMPANSGSFSKGDQLWGKHNTAIQQCIFAVLEEPFWAGDRSAEGRLKDLVTSATQMIEPKFVDPFEVANFTRLWLNKNEPWSFPASGDERRLFALEASDAHRRDIPYFKAIDAQMSAGGLEAMLHDLLNLPQPDWIELRLPPDTPWLVRQIAYSLHTDQAWLRSVLTEGAIVPANPHQKVCAWPDIGDGPMSAVDQAAASLRGGAHPVNGERMVDVVGFVQHECGGIDVPTDVVRDAFRKHVADMKRGGSYTTPEQLGEFLAKFGVTKTRPTIRGTRVWSYRFPSLHVMRARFTDETKIGFDEAGPVDVRCEAGTVDVADLDAWRAYGCGGPLPRPLA